MHETGVKAAACAATNFLSRAGSRELSPTPSASPKGPSASGLPAPAGGRSRPRQAHSAWYAAQAHEAAEGALAFGFVGDVRTAERVAAVIMNEWQVTYHPSHVAKLLHARGWSRQKPTRRARQRNEEAISEWQEAGLPALKKKR